MQCSQKLVQQAVNHFKRLHFEPFGDQEMLLHVSSRSALKEDYFFIENHVGCLFIWSLEGILQKNVRTHRYEGSLRQIKLIHRMQFAYQEPFICGESEQFEEGEASPFYFGNPQYSMNHLKRILSSRGCKVQIHESKLSC